MACAGVAKERLKARTAARPVHGRQFHFAYRWKTVCVNRYHLCFLDQA